MTSRTANPLEQVLFEVKRTIVGQDMLLERMAIGLLSGGHLLVEGVPGLAKTLAVKSLAAAIGGQFQRIQFTPDLVPADLTGTRVYRQHTGEFETSRGPVFTNLLLADEINRAPAKVQSALLEVMQERQVTIGRETFAVPEPVPGHGDAEPDRVRGHLPAARGAGRPLHAQGASCATRRCPRSTRSSSGRCIPGPGPQSILTPGRPRSRMQAEVAQVYADPAVVDYAVRLVAATRAPGTVGLGDLDRYVTYGASPRASIALAAGRTGAGLPARPRLRAAPGRRANSPWTCCGTAWCCPTRRWPTTSTPTRSSPACCKAVRVPEVVLQAR